jgi:hypothetical protein
MYKYSFSNLFPHPERTSRSHGFGDLCLGPYSADKILFIVVSLEKQVILFLRVLYNISASGQMMHLHRTLLHTIIFSVTYCRKGSNEIRETPRLR